MTSTRLAVTALALLSAVSAARADATLTPVEGGVLVSKGQGFSRVTQVTALKTGDRAMVAQGSRGKITFPDGCAVDLRPGSVQIVGPVSPCARAQGGNQGRDCVTARNPEERTALGCDVVGYGTAAAVILLGGTAAGLSLSQSDAKEQPGMSP